MKAFGLTMRIAGATLVLLALQTFWSHLWLSGRFDRELGLPALSGLLVVLSLSLVAANSSQEGATLAATLFVLYFGINCLNSLEESALFKIGPTPHEVFHLIGSWFCTAVIFTPLLVVLLGYWRNSGQEEAKTLVPRSTAGWVVRIVTGVLLYVLCYSIAATATLPIVKDFAVGFAPPTLADMVKVEILPGLVYVAAGLAVTSGMKGKRSRAAATLGLAFPILAGVAPLLVANPYIPNYIRMAHGFEVGFSNLAYGALLGHVLALRATPNIAVQQGGNAESPS